tara:strand:- start:235 stop:426 length:192 start_codon:yes stop_codon:yes gene_type:complete
MTKEYIKEIPNWEKDYFKMIGARLLTTQQIELLEGRDIKSHEGMLYGQMYNDWKRLKGFDTGY